MLSTQNSWIHPLSILSSRAPTMPKSSHWLKLPLLVGNTRIGSPASPNRRISMSRPSDGLHSLAYARNTPSPCLEVGRSVLHGARGAVLSVGAGYGPGSRKRIVA